MSVIIGVTASYDDDGRQYFLPEGYAAALSRAGAPAFILPDSNRAHPLPDCLERVDGLLLSGGVDVDPFHFGEEPVPGLGKVTPGRDLFEIELVREAWERDMPILAICRGIQVLNIALGGTLHQDIASIATVKHNQDAPGHHPTHTVDLAAGSLLRGLAGREEVRVNSFHHQAIRDPAPGLRVVARSRDGIVEAVEGPGKKWVVGVQWHPEHSVSTDRLSAALFEAFVAGCRKA